MKRYARTFAAILLLLAVSISAIGYAAVTYTTYYGMTKLPRGSAAWNESTRSRWWGTDRQLGCLRGSTPLPDRTIKRGMTMNPKEQYVEPKTKWLKDFDMYASTSSDTLCCFFCHRDLSNAMSVNYVAEGPVCSMCLAKMQDQSNPQ